MTREIKPYPFTKKNLADLNKAAERIRSLEPIKFPYGDREMQTVLRNLNRKRRRGARYAG